MDAANMTPEDLAATLQHYDELTGSYQRMLAASEQRAADLLRIQTELKELKEKTDKELAARGDLLISTTMKHNHQRDAARRACAELVQALRALRGILTCVKDRADGSWEVADIGAFVRAVQEGREVLALIDIPF